MPLADVVTAPFWLSLLACDENLLELLLLLQHLYTFLWGAIWHFEDEALDEPAKVEAELLDNVDI